MTAILSRRVPAFDISAQSFRGAACDLGEVIAILAGGAKPDPETYSRLAISLRSLQGFLQVEAEQQEGREVVAEAFDGAMKVVSLSGRPASLPPAFLPRCPDAARAL